MKNLKYVCSALLALSLMAIPAAAQKDQSNKGGVHVQKTNKKQDKDHDPSSDNDKSASKGKGHHKGNHKGETQGKHYAKGHSH